MKSFLFLPMPPTPNGRMHVGHIAGPYLTADASARALRRSGHSVMVASGVDAYENWVVLAARQAGLDSKELCRINSAGIERDFRLMNIQFDSWIDPMSEEHRSSYVQFHDDMFRQLRLAGKVRRRAESVPISSQSGDYVIGAWIQGRCPQCGSDVAGNSCVRCGASFQPSEIVDARSRLDDGDLTWVTKSSWFAYARPDRVIQALTEASVPIQWRHIAEAHLSRSGGKVRVTQPGRWGIKSDQVDEDCVITNTYYAFSLYAARTCGLESVMQIANAKPIISVGFFGKDNAGIALVAPAVISAASEKYKYFSKVFVNGMLTFEGSKCSTSKNHGIWVAELLDHTSVSSDELRFALAHIDLSAADADLTTCDLLSRVNELRNFISSKLFHALEAVEGVECHLGPSALAAVRRQEAFLTPPSICLCEAVKVLRDWMTQPIDDNLTLNAWLCAFAVLAEPITPELAFFVWRSLGKPGRPTIIATVAQANESALTEPRFNAPPLTLSELNPVIHMGY